MNDLYPYKFNVSTLEHDKVGNYLATIPSYRYSIARRQYVGELSLEEWRTVKEAALSIQAATLANGEKVSNEEAIAALLSTDSDEGVDITVLGLPARATRRLLNRVAIQAGLNESGIAVEDHALMFRQASEGYLIQFSNADDARNFKLAMWSVVAG